MIKNDFKERVNYTIEDGSYCGYTVNMPIVIQGLSLDDLKIKTRQTVEMYINDLQRTLDNDLFEYIEQPLIKKLEL